MSEKITTKQRIRCALARGYCTDKNKNKVLDPDLCEAMACEIDKLMNEICFEVN